MSCYIHFFVKVGDEFAPISSFSRSTKIYELFEYVAPWEKVRPLSEARLRKVLSDAIERVQELNKKLDEMPARKALIASFNNAVDEKMEALSDLEENECYLGEELDEMQRAVEFVRFLIWIVDEASGAAYEDTRFNSEKYLYVGMECGYMPEEET